jgi:putative Mg2+ transporter-C (MgtC) family protein
MTYLVSSKVVTTTGEDFMISFPTVLLRLCVALLLGAVIGVERQNHAQAAGLRTNALVALGSCLFMIISAYGFEMFLNLPHIQVDPSRVASYVVAGIGFLGAGTIFRSQEGERVKGLTTAAAIWVVSAIGLACGLGFLLEAAVTTVLAVIILFFLRFVEWFFWRDQLSSVEHIHIEATAATGEFIGEVYNTCARTGVTIEKLRVHTEKEGAMIDLSCVAQNMTILSRTIGALQALPGTQAVDASHKGVTHHSTATY